MQHRGDDWMFRVLCFVLALTRGYSHFPGSSYFSPHHPERAQLQHSSHKTVHSINAHEKDTTLCEACLSDRFPDD